MRKFLPSRPFLLSLSLVIPLAVAAQSTEPEIKVLRHPTASSVMISVAGKDSEHRVGDRVGNWTVMAVNVAGPGKTPVTVLEDFTSKTGHIRIVNSQGVQLDLPKSLESTSADPAKLYLGHTLAEVMSSASDLLGDQILVNGGDPKYDEVAAAFAPIRNFATYSFIGTPQNTDKIAIEYGGRTPNFDPAPYESSIQKIREAGRVMDGLVGSYLPVMRFVYPESDEKWTEMLAFAPFRISDGNSHVQPVWYRVVRVESGSVKWAKYIDSYHPFPPRTDYDPKIFYGDLQKLSDGWSQKLQGAMKIDIPDKRLMNMARFGIVRDMMTRNGDYPKYGVVDRNYGGTEHDGFPDTFNVDTAAMLEWGLIDVAARYIDNYFGKYVRDDGSILYRGPEIGQYGRMLTVLAQFKSYGGDPQVLLRNKSRIDGVTNLLLGLRAKVKQLPKDDAAYGMIAGWSEADASLDADPARYMQPYFSNSAEASRGLRDLGNAWIEIGKRNGNQRLVAWGQRLEQESRELQADMQAAIAKSMLKVDGDTVLPSIAGVKEPFHVVVPRDNSDPQFRSYRAYMEMLHSGMLKKEQVENIVNYRWNHHDIILGVPTAYGFKTGAMAGFLSYGHGYGLIQHDDTRRALLLLYSVMAHNFTRGTWTAPETRPTFDTSPAAPYCTPAQLAVTLMARWLLVFEDPQSETLWLAKATPREWLEDGKMIAVEGAPTRWGKVSYKMTSHLDQGKVSAFIDVPPSAREATVQLRLRVPEGKSLKSVTVNGKDWREFNASSETVTIRPGMSGRVEVAARY